MGVYLSFDIALRNCQILFFFARHWVPFHFDLQSSKETGSCDLYIAGTTQRQVIKSSSLSNDESISQLSDNKVFKFDISTFD